LESGSSWTSTGRRSIKKRGSELAAAQEPSGARRKRRVQTWGRPNRPLYEVRNFEGKEVAGKEGGSGTEKKMFKDTRGERGGMGEGTHSRGKRGNKIKNRKPGHHNLRPPPQKETPGGRKEAELHRATDDGQEKNGSQQTDDENL